MTDSKYSRLVLQKRSEYFQLHYSLAIWRRGAKERAEKHEQVKHSRETDTPSSRQTFHQHLNHPEPSLLTGWRTRSKLIKHANLLTISCYSLKQWIITTDDADYNTDNIYSQVV